MINIFQKAFDFMFDEKSFGIELLYVTSKVLKNSFFLP